jgi:hypothetical protein
MAFNIKQNDTSPSLRATLKDGNNSAVDLTGASIRFHMVSLDGTAVVDSAATVISPASSGVVQYNWVAGDTQTAGAYNAEFEVAFSNGKIETFPNDSYISVSIRAELA